MTNFYDCYEFFLISPTSSNVFEYFHINSGPSKCDTTRTTIYLSFLIFRNIITGRCSMLIYTYMIYIHHCIRQPAELNWPFHPRSRSNIYFSLLYFNLFWNTVTTFRFIVCDLRGKEAATIWKLMQTLVSTILQYQHHHEWNLLPLIQLLKVHAPNRLLPGSTRVIELHGIWFCCIKFIQICGRNAITFIFQLLAKLNMQLCRYLIGKRTPMKKLQILIFAFISKQYNVFVGDWECASYS